MPRKQLQSSQLMYTSIVQKRLLFDLATNLFHDMVLLWQTSGAVSRTCGSRLAKMFPFIL